MPFCRVSLGQGLSQGCNQGMDEGFSHLKAHTGGGSVSKARSRGFWQVSGPHGLLTRDIISMPRGLLHRAFNSIAARAPQSLPAREQERESKMEVTKSFRNLISEVPAHVFCCIVFMRSEALGPANTQWERIKQDINPRRWGSLGHFRGFLSHRGLVRHWWQDSKNSNSEARGGQCPLRPGLGTCLCLAKASHRAKCQFKGWGNSLHLLVRKAA